MPEKPTTHPLLRSFLFALYVYLTGLFVTPFVLVLETIFVDRNSGVTFSDGEFIDFTLGFFLETLYMGIPFLLVFWFGAHQTSRLDLSGGKQKLALMGVMGVAILINFVGIYAIAFPQVSVPYFIVFCIAILIYTLPASPTNRKDSTADELEREQ